MSESPINNGNPPEANYGLDREIDETPPGLGRWLLTQSTGDGYPGRRNATARPAIEEAASAFQDHARFQNYGGWEPTNAIDADPYLYNTSDRQPVMPMEITAAFIPAPARGLIPQVAGGLKLPMPSAAAGPNITQTANSVLSQMRGRRAMARTTQLAMEGKKSFKGLPGQVAFDPKQMQSFLQANNLGHMWKGGHYQVKGADDLNYSGLYTTDHLDPRMPESMQNLLDQAFRTGMGPTQDQATSKMFDDLKVMTNPETMNSQGEGTSGAPMSGKEAALRGRIDARRRYGLWR